MTLISIWHCREELEGRCVIKQLVVIVGRYKQLKQHVVISWSAEVQPMFVLVHRSKKGFVWFGNIINSHLFVFVCRSAVWVCHSAAPLPHRQTIPWWKRAERLGTRQWQANTYALGLPHFLHCGPRPFSHGWGLGLDWRPQPPSDIQSQPRGRGGRAGWGGRRQQLANRDARADPSSHLTWPFRVQRVNRAGHKQQAVLWYVWFDRGGGQEVCKDTGCVRSVPS